jgi:hypothetical protein
MGSGTRLVLFGHKSGISGVAGLDPFVCVALHLLARCGAQNIERFLLIITISVKCARLLKSVVHFV